MIRAIRQLRPPPRCAFVILALMASGIACGPDPGGAHLLVAGPSSQQPGPPRKGVRAFVRLQDEERTEDLNNRLHFCVFENGADDWIYVGVKYGMWSAGEFDLEVAGRPVFTGHVDPLLYGGALLSMGDVVQGQLDHGDLQVTRVTGWFR